MRFIPSAIAVILACACVSVSAAEFHVAPTGSSSNPGTADQPFATLTQARDAVRLLNQQGLPEGGVTVWIHGGVYELGESFALTAEDSGLLDRPVVYRAVAGEEVRLVGGRQIPSNAFAPVTDETVRNRVDSAARDQVVATNLKALGVSELAEYPDQFRDPPVEPELFCDGERMTLARWPNDDWAHVANVIESGPAPWRNHQSDQPGTFEYEGDRPSRWLNAPNVWLHGYWCFDWCAETIKTKQIDVEKRQMTFVSPHCYGLGSGNSGPRRYYAVNLLEELDTPGEYYIDRAAAVLYFWPPKPLEQARIVLSTLQTPIVVMNDVSFVTLQGVTLETCCQHGIEMKGGVSNRIAQCTVRNTGHDGIIVEGGEKHQVVACDIYDTGRAGLRIGGGDRVTLTPCGHEAVNNHIYRVSRRQRTHAYHVHLSGVGVRLAHNLLHDAPHQAIGLAGNDHVIEFNEIHHTGQETDDCGAFYMGRNPSERGSILRYNFWHHIGSTFAHGSSAIYFDDGSGGQTVYGNVFYKAAGGQHGAVFVHGGHQNTVENNIFVECIFAFRQVPWKDAAWREALADDDWQNKLVKEIDISKPPYIDRYPELKDYMTPPDAPRLNYASHNIVYNCGGFVQGNWTIFDNVVTNDDPGFVDAANLNFKLKDDSAVLGRMEKFENIPFEQIGLMTDEYRTELPDPGRRAE